MGRLIDRTGQRYGRLIVTARQAGPASYGRRSKWVCVCDCGGTKIATGHELASGDTKSCGCLRKEITSALRKSHGRTTKDPTYMSWCAAKNRCYTRNSTKFSEYGGRGIAMCERWRNSFEEFLSDMGERPTGKTLDRIDPNGNYEPLNCRWATPAQQSSNTRRNIIWRGERTTIKAVADRVSVPRTSLNKLIARGMPIEDAVSYAIAHRK